MLSFHSGTFTAVTGVSGSGKSTLVNEVLPSKALYQHLGRVRMKPGEHKSIKGFEHLDKLITIDQNQLVEHHARVQPHTQASLMQFVIYLRENTRS